MSRVIHVALAIALGSRLAGAVETPIRDLAKDEIPAALQSGKIQRTDNEITLRVRRSLYSLHGEFIFQQNTPGR